MYLSICLSVCLSVYLSIHPWLYSHLLDIRRFFSFLKFYTVGVLGRGISPSQGLYLHTEEHRQTSMPRVGFEPTILVFEWAKMVHHVDRVATVVGYVCHTRVWRYSSTILDLVTKWR
jgi:hypothetical protein